jgi:hypothetical protein
MRKEETPGDVSPPGVASDVPECLTEDNATDDILGDRVLCGKLFLRGPFIGMSLANLSDLVFCKMRRPMPLAPRSALGLVF